MNKPKHYRGGFEYSGSLMLTRELRQTSTDAETLLWDRLRNRRLLAFKSRRQHQVGKYVVDFYCAEARLVIECDGGIHSRAQAWHHDQNREAYMSALGLRTLRFTNEEVLNETERVLSEMGEYLSAVHSRAGTQKVGVAKATLPHPNPLPKGEGENPHSKDPLPFHNTRPLYCNRVTNK